MGTCRLAERRVRAKKLESSSLRSHEWRATICNGCGHTVIAPHGAWVHRMALERTVSPWRVKEAHRNLVAAGDGRSTWRVGTHRIHSAERAQPMTRMKH